jgi:hypothetical protein
MRVRRLSTLSRLTLRAGDSISFPHSTVFDSTDFSVSSWRLTVAGLTVRGSLLLERTPGSVQAITFELLDAMRGYLGKDRRPEEAIQRLQNLAIPLRALLVQVRVIAQVDGRKLLERDVRVPPNAVAPVEDP